MILESFLNEPENFSEVEFQKVAFLFFLVAYNFVILNYPNVDDASQIILSYYLFIFTFRIFYNVTFLQMHTPDVILVDDFDIPLE